MSFRKWSEAQNDSIKIDTGDIAASPSAGSASAGGASAGAASTGDKQATQPAKQPAIDDKP